MQAHRASRSTALVAGALACSRTVDRPQAAASARVVPVATLDDPVGFTFTPNGRVVYLERATGRGPLPEPTDGHGPPVLPDRRA